MKAEKYLRNISNIYCTNLCIDDLLNEIWIDCLGYDGIYSVSNLGRIKAKQREVRCGSGYWLRPSKILKQQITKSNPNNVRFESKSLHVSLSVDCQKKTFNVSELVGQAFLGDKKEDECYSKNNKLWYDCRAENLEIKSKSESFKDAYKKGLCDRNKKSLTHNHEPVNIFIRLSDGKEFIGGKELRKEYGYDNQSGIKNSLKTGNKCKGSFWKIKPINETDQSQQ